MHGGPNDQQVTGALQHEAWLDRSMPPVEDLGAGLWSIPVVFSDNPLRYVTSYALAGDDGVVLVDTGWDDDAAWTSLCDGLASFGASVADVRGILVTHLHFDHIGLARRVVDASDAWVGIHEADARVMGAPDHLDAHVARGADVAFLISLGASSEEAAESAASTDELERFARTASPTRILAAGERIEVPGRLLRAVHTPGHTPGHVCFLDERERRLFSGDHLLPRITPNISIHRSWPEDALTTYVDSLRATAGLDVVEVLPAHEWRFTGHAARAEEIVAHHERRSVELLGIVAAEPGLTPWQLAGRMSWSRPWASYRGFMKVAAVTETAAHLLHLVTRGSLVRSGGPQPTYEVAPAAR